MWFSGYVCVWEGKKYGEWCAQDVHHWNDGSFYSQEERKITWDFGRNREQWRQGKMAERV